MPMCSPNQRTPRAIGFDDDGRLWHDAVGGQSNTTTSPRRGSCRRYDSFDTRILSSISSVWTGQSSQPIEGEGMKNAWNTKVRSRNATSTAAMARSGTSRSSALAVAGHAEDDDACWLTANGGRPSG